MPSAALPSPALKPHILVVDDDDRLRALLRRYLAEQGFMITTATDAGDARAKLKSLAYDLMVLDVMMPGESGLQFTKSLYDGDRIQGFEMGADDYLQKPFEPRELLLRINAILRRIPKPVVTMPDLKLGIWQYDPQRDELRSPSETARLTGMEAGLMRILATEPGVPVTREKLAELSKGTINDRTVDVQVTRLRRKIEDDAKNPRYLVTVRGEGYMLLPDVD
jgi:two-component system phosphate regulon response regulator OmpR